jgi:hypothetical protein
VGAIVALLLVLLLRPDRTPARIELAGLHNLAALPSFFWGQLFAGKGQATSLGRGESNPLFAGGGAEGFLGDPILLRRVVQLSPHPLADRRRDHGDDKLEGSDNLPVQGCRSKLPIFANLWENSRDSFLDITGLAMPRLLRIHDCLE